MRFVLIFTMATLTAIPAFAANTGKIPDTQELTALAAKAAQATPKDRCYLYAELVSGMTELASQQMNAGNSAAAANSLKAIQDYTAKIHLDLNNNSRKLKDAQIMMRHTAFRLKELMMNASLNDQQAFETTLKQMDQVQTQMMLAVFQK
jgi:serine phosphatase RsbU (regulator of sigma subunit)